MKEETNFPVEGQRPNPELAERMLSVLLDHGRLT
jgi:hypothetical protein